MRLFDQHYTTIILRTSTTTCPNGNWTQEITSTTVTIKKKKKKNLYCITFKISFCAVDPLGEALASNTEVIQGTEYITLIKHMGEV